MGQTLEVNATVVADVAIFDTDRSITGQDGRSYVGPVESAAVGLDPPGVLATRLFESDGEISHVHVLSNTVSVKRIQGWDDAILESATKIVANLFEFYDSDADPWDPLREENYNATLTHIRAHNEELWVTKVKPDEPVPEFGAGQYTTLGLGYWEPRADDATEDFDDEQRRKMARRSYSVSSSIIDIETGELEPAHPTEVEFYIVQVPPGEEEIPALTPRIFLKEEGDRIYMSHKFTGRYTLEGVQPGDNIVFLSTGTGEAPQNAMTAELLRRGHQGKILNLVCVRLRRDLAYTEQQEMVESKFDNYQFEYITTREPENKDNKVYIQDLITSGRLEEILGAPLDPDSTHVFLCGNPAMIGLPKWEDDNPVFPDTVGVCELLAERGFTIDHLKTKGNVHFEEYWKER